MRSFRWCTLPVVRSKAVKKPSISTSRFFSSSHLSSLTPLRIHECLESCLDKKFRYDFNNDRHKLSFLFLQKVGPGYCPNWILPNELWSQMTLNNDFRNSPYLNISEQKSRHRLCADPCHNAKAKNNKFKKNKHSCKKQNRMLSPNNVLRTIAKSMNCVKWIVICQPLEW